MDPVRFRPFIGLSAFGKLAAAIGVALPWLAGAIDARLPALDGGDVIFAALFLDYLRRTRGEGPKPSKGIS